MEEVFPILPILTPCARAQIQKPTFCDPRRAFFLAKKMLPEYVFDASKMENNPLMFPEVQTLLDGVSIGGRKITDVEQVSNIRDTWNFILSGVRERRFALDLATYPGSHQPRWLWNLKLRYARGGRLWCYEIFKREKPYEIRQYGERRAFGSWLSGVASALDLTFLYRVSARDVVQAWLQQTDDEAESYDEWQSEERALGIVVREFFAMVKLA